MHVLEADPWSDAVTLAALRRGKALFGAAKLLAPLGEALASFGQRPVQSAIVVQQVHPRLFRVWWAQPEQNLAIHPASPVRFLYGKGEKFELLR